MEKTYIFGDGQNSGFDTNLLAAMNNGGFGGGSFSNPFWAIILLAFLRNGFGWGGNEGGCNTAFVSSQLGQAIAGNANAISNLATSLNCTEGQIQSAIAGVQNSIQQVANANNMTGMQIVNAVQAGNSGIMNSLQSCCCDIKTAVATGFGNLAYENASNTCAIKQNATDNAGRILAKLDAMEDSRKDREINALTAQLTAANSRAERAAELAPVYQALNDIKSRQPNTVAVQWPNLTAVPTAQLYGIGTYGVNPGGSIWG